MAVIAISGCLAENGMAWRTMAERGEYDGPLMKRIQRSQYKNFHSVYPNLGIFSKRWTSHRPAFKPMFYSGYKNPVTIGIQEPESDESKVAERLSASEDKRNKEPKKSGGNGKDDFDSNSYFMLRPLRRAPPETDDRQKMFNILGNSTKIAKYYFTVRFLRMLNFIILPIIEIILF